MHSSRMSTARLLPVSPSMHCSRGGIQGNCPGRGVYLRGVYLAGVGVLAHVTENITLPQASFAGGNN